MEFRENWNVCSAPVPVWCLKGPVNDVKPGMAGGVSVGAWAILRWLPAPSTLTAGCAAQWRAKAPEETAFLGRIPGLEPFRVLGSASTTRSACLFISPRWRSAGSLDPVSDGTGRKSYHMATGRHMALQPRPSDIYHQSLQFVIDNLPYNCFHDNPHADFSQITTQPGITGGHAE
jgi:hypothetical protein